jgi:tetratricopeptide (TPR) repeat protein/CHAT domain-containing protein
VRTRRAGCLPCLTLSVVVLAHPALAQPPATTPSPAAAKPAADGAQAPDAAGLFRDVLTRYYEAYARKDLPAIEALWHPGGPARNARNLLEVDFESRSVTLRGVQVVQASIDAGGGRARALIDLDVKDLKTSRGRHERRLRELTFLQDGTTWKIWNDGGPGLGVQVASRLLGTPAGERAALVASDPEVRSDDVLAGLAFAANGLRSQGKLADVIDAQTVRASLARALGNDAVLAAALQDVGLVQQVLGRRDEAAQAFSEARDLFVKVGTRMDVAIADSNIAGVDYVRGEYASAADHYRSALETFEAETDGPRAASALHGLGNALYMQGDFEPALASYQRCLALHDASDNKYSASSVLQAIALVHKEVGNYSAAVDAYGRSGVLSTAMGDMVGVARAEHGLGELYRLTGDYASALQHLAASLAAWEKTPDRASRAGTMFVTGQVYALQRNFARAVEWYQRALDLDQKIGEQPGVARDLGGLGGAHFAQGQLDAALEEYLKSLALRQRLQDAPGIMWTLVHLGVLHSVKGSHVDALEVYQRALGMAEASGDAGAVCTVLALRAANELAREDVDAALATSAKAAEMSQRLELFDALAYARTTAGKALRKAGRTAEAGTALEEAVGALDRVPVGPGVETFFDDRRGPYLALIDFLVSEHRVEDAFRWSERARTRAMAYMLGGDGAVVGKGLSAAEREQERRLIKESRALGVRIRRERARVKPDPERVATAARDLDRVVADRTAFRRTLYEAHPDLPTLRAQTDAAGVEKAADVLGRSEAIVAFAVAEARTTVFVVSRSTGAAAGVAVTAATIEVKATDLASRVSGLRDAVARRDVRAQALARDLYDTLLGPVRERLAGTSAIVILPDAFLWSLPFEALKNAAGRYLIETVTVSYAPSLTALAVMRAVNGGPASSRGVAQGSSASKGAPPSLRLPGAAVRLVAAGEPAIAAASQERLALVRATDAPPFPASSRELRSLALLFGPQACRILSKDQASADRIVAAVRPPTALHLALPVSLLDGSPLFSPIAFAPNGPNDRVQGVTDVADTMEWTLPAELVVLSRADHGQAGITGDGVVALGWAFLIAGSPTVVVNRWLPAPGEAAGLATSFYRAWLARRAVGDGRSTAATALQRAARAIIARPGSEPADWAGLMVIGR